MEASAVQTEAPLEAGGHKVTPLELFFDLVFVLAFTQVTTKLAIDQTWSGLGRALLVLAVLWWAWGGYAWLTNAFDPEAKLMRLPVFVAMAALLITALAVPQAFGANAAIFAWSYFVVRMIHISLFLFATRQNKDVFRAVLRLTPAMVAAPVILLISVAFDGRVQAAIWILAILVDYSGPYWLGGEGWQVAPEHFAERFGLIVIIALGESVVSIGVGATGLPLDLRTICAAIIGIGLVSALWWMYFDVVALVAARKLGEAVGIARTKLARDTYSVLHYFLIAGIILLALAIKKSIAHPDVHLREIPAVSLCLGLALFSITMSVIRKRDVGDWNWQRLFVGALMLALFPLAKKLPSLETLAIALAIFGSLIVYEAIRYRDIRMRIRAQRE
jgi:low temperature requirement protein LtrA